MRLLITGVTGFVGTNLLDECARNKIEVVGVSHTPISKEISSKLSKGYQIDMTKKAEIAKLDLNKIDGVIHLAGLAAVGPSFDKPALYVQANTAMLVNLCEAAIAQRKKHLRIINVSSGATYSSDQPMPLSESAKLAYSSPYSVSKIACEHLGEYYRTRNLDVINVRPFNHVGPSQLTGFIIPDLYEQLSKNKSGKEIIVGNLDSKRDYTDVRDVAKAYLALLKTKNLSSTLYNICSGKSYSGKEILDKICDALEVKTPKTKIDYGKFRPNDAPDIVGSSARIRKDTGWKPEIDLQTSISDFIASQK